MEPNVDEVQKTVLFHLPRDGDAAGITVQYELV